MAAVRPGRGFEDPEDGAHGGDPYVAGEGTRLLDDVPKSYQLDLVSGTEFSTEPSGCTTAGTAKPAADTHDEWQSGERHYLSEGSIVIADSLRRWDQAAQRVLGWSMTGGTGRRGGWLVC